MQTHKTHSLLTPLTLAAPGGLLVGLWILCLSGCGGNSSAPAITPLNLDIHWAAQSRVLNAPSSARSAVLILARASPNGRDASFILNRNPTPAEYTQHFVSSTVVRVGTWAFTARFCADSDGQGSVVGLASAIVTLHSDGTGIGDLLTQGIVASVAVPSGQSLGVTERKDLAFTVRDGSGNLLSVSPGSLFWTVTSAGENVRVMNGQLFGAAAGTATVTATVDGKTSLPASLTVVYRGLARTPWPKLHADAQNTSRGSGSGATGIEKWRLDLPASAYGFTPVLIGANGLLYVCYEQTGGGHLIAIDSATHTIRWASPTYCQPALGVDGTLYVVSHGTPSQWEIQALDATSGALKWSSVPDKGLDLEVTLGPDGTVYAASLNALFALDAATGQTKWSAALLKPSLPAIGMDGTLFVTVQGNALTALDNNTGAVRWSVAVADAQLTLPTVGLDNTVYIGDLNGAVYAYDGATGRLRWQQKTPSGGVFTLALGTEGNVYAGNDGRVYTLDSQTGALRWSFTGSPGLSAGLSVGGDGTVYVANRDQYALDGRTGQKKWTFANTDQFINGGFTLEPTVDEDGTVYAIQEGYSSTLIAIH